VLVPAVLAVSTLPPACNGKEGTTVATEAPTEATGSTTEDTPTSTGGTSTGTDTRTGTDTSTGTTGGELPDCPKYSDDPETCSSMVQCIFLINQDACIVRCDNFDDQASCEMQMYCYWEGDCYLAV
jgi:hypothetical protein